MIKDQRGAKGRDLTISATGTGARLAAMNVAKVPPQKPVPTAAPAPMIR